MGFLFELKPVRTIPRLSFLTLSGLALLLICSIPVTSVYEVINTQFMVGPGAKYGPYDAGTYYHATMFGKCVLRGELIVEGEGIYLTAYGYNTQHLNGVYVIGKSGSTIDPADDLYTFVFDNTEGHSESLGRFTLEEIWTGPIASGSHTGFITALIGFFLFLAGLVAFAISRHRRRVKESTKIGTTSITDVGGAVWKTRFSSDFSLILCEIR